MDCGAYDTLMERSDIPDFDGSVAADVSLVPPFDNSSQDIPCGRNVARLAGTNPNLQDRLLVRIPIQNIRLARRLASIEQLRGAIAKADRSKVTTHRLVPHSSHRLFGVSCQALYTGQFSWRQGQGASSR
jgi:hypothetical protein